jgi:Ca2+/Na+ antiporter
MMSVPVIYSEKVISKKTEFLFVALTLLFFILLIWRVMVSCWDILAGVILFLFCFFLFYSFNYRILVIRLTSESLKLSFGIFTWTIPLNDISGCQLDDDLPVLMKYGGAGIHFMVIRNRYRASFNFLEHARVVIRLKRTAGLVKDISFSTCYPNELIQLIQAAISTNQPA